MIWEIEDGPRAVEGLDERGRPRPEYAAALGLRPAPLGRRVLATVTEGLFLGLLQLPMLLVALPAVLAAAASDDPVGDLLGRDDALWVVLSAVIPYALTTVFLLIQLILLGRRGVTLGKALTGLRAVNVATLERPRFWRGAVVRYLVLCASFLLPLIGPLLVVSLSPLFDPQRRRRGWPDLAAATWLVDIRKGLNPYDAKRMRIARKTVATDLRDEKTALPSLATPVSAPSADVYIPVARNRGGVLGAPRDRGAGAPATEQRDPGPAAPIQGSPFAAPADPVAPAAPLPTREPAAPAVPVERIRPAAVSETVAPSAETLLPRGETSSWSPPRLVDAPQPAASLLLDTGDAIAVPAGGAVIGRAPAAAGEDAGASAVPVADPTMSMSKTHVALRWQAGVLVAVDLGSTNGSAIIRAGAETELAPGAPETLRTGDTLRFGDRHATVSIG